MFTSVSVLIDPLVIVSGNYTMVEWEDVKAKLIRPNLECTNGYIHLTDTVMIDDTPPWAVGSAPGHRSSSLIALPFVVALSISFRLLISV